MKKNYFCTRYEKYTIYNNSNFKYFTWLKRKYTKIKPASTSSSYHPNPRY